MVCCCNPNAGSGISNLPFVFENVGKEAGRVDELLMPADLLAEGSVLRNAVEVMTPEDCGVDDPSGNVEIIGWLYSTTFRNARTR